MCWSGSYTAFCIASQLPRDLISITLQLQNQHQQTDIRSYTQHGQHEHHVARSPEPLPSHDSHRTSIIASNALCLSEELPIPLLSAVSTDGQHPGTVDGKEGADAVEFAREDLEHDEREGELGQRGADVGAFERALCSADLDELLGSEVDGAGAVEA